MATPEQIKAARLAAAELAARMVWDKPLSHPYHVEVGLLNTILAAVPPLPEPERPRITPARELAKRIAEEDDYSTSRVLAAQRAIAEARGEIIALLEHRLGPLLHTSMNTDDCGRCVVQELLTALREADKA